MNQTGTPNGFWTPVRLALILSVLVVLGFALMAFQDRCEEKAANARECKKNFQWFMELSPNEFGDTLAGLFGSLAFIWIVATVLMQSKELSLQRLELELTRGELSAQRSASEDMAKSMQAQVAAMEQQTLALLDEMSSRTVAQYDKEFLERYLILKKLWIDCLSECDHVAAIAGFFNMNLLMRKDKPSPIPEREEIVKFVDNDGFLIFMAQRMAEYHRTDEEMRIPNTIFKIEHALFCLRRIQNEQDSILALVPKLSTAYGARANQLGFKYEGLYSNTSSYIREHEDALLRSPKVPREKPARRKEE